MYSNLLCDVYCVIVQYNYLYAYIYIILYIYRVFTFSAKYRNLMLNIPTDRITGTAYMLFYRVTLIPWYLSNAQKPFSPKMYLIIFLIINEIFYMILFY